MSKKTSSSKDTEKEHDWYAILGCTVESTKSAIEKAARKLFLKYHPDKTTDPKAPELFLLVQKAKEILLDDEKRKVIDDVKRAFTKREEYENQRSKGMDVRRKRMREELEEKLGAQSKVGTTAGSSGVPMGKTSSSSSSSSSSSGSSVRGSAIDLERLRKEGASLREASTREAELREAQRVYDFAEKKRAIEHEQWLKSAANQVKIKWKRSRQNHSDDSLYQLFKEFGSIETVTLVGEKGNAALITFTAYESAKQAVEAYVTSTEYRVTLPADDAQAEKKRAAIFTHIYSEGSSSTVHKGPEIISMSNVPSNNESDLMRQMRRAVEREQLIRALGEEEKTKSTESSGTVKKTDSSQAAATSGMGISGTSSTIFFSTTTTMPSSSVETGNLAAKEADVLQRMMEAAKLKKQKSDAAAAAAVAVAVASDTTTT